MIATGSRSIIVKQVDFITSFDCEGGNLIGASHSKRLVPTRCNAVFAKLGFSTATVGGR